MNKLSFELGVQISREEAKRITGGKVGGDCESGPKCGDLNDPACPAGKTCSYQWAVCVCTIVN
jgi:hypothetical protein